MCVSKVYVRDYIRSRGNYFNCGSCPACRQAIANRRCRRIRGHQPEDTTCFFITLTYKNEHIPYIKLSDLYALIEGFNNGLDFDDYRFAVYRDYSVRFNRGKLKVTRNNKPIAYLPIKKIFNYDDIQDLLPLRVKIKNSFRYEHDKISIAYTPDAQNFLKRLRENLYRCFQERVDITYFYAPEYGPTTSRFHIHFLVWVPRKISFHYGKFIECYRKAWPYADKSRFKKSIEFARCPESYLASYVNCGVNVSRFLQKTFRLRPSHSLNFGFSADVFSFQNVHEAFTKRESFKYHVSYFDKSGNICESDLYYPAYIRNRYYPRIKHFNKLSRDTLLKVYGSPEKCLRITKLCKYGSGKLCEKLYETNVFRTDGLPYVLTERESKYYIKRINYCYDAYYRPLGISRLDFADFVLRYNDAFFTSLYIESQTDIPPSEYIYAFFNISDVKRGYIRNDTLLPLLEGIADYKLDPDVFPLEIEQTKLLTKKFEDNIKHRSISQINV